jgi:hypothetical protein
MAADSTTFNNQHGGLQGRLSTLSDSLMVDIVAHMEAIRKLASKGDSETRLRVMSELYGLATSMEDTNDTIHRYGYLVRQSHAAMTLS